MSFPWVHHSFEFCSFKQLFIEHSLHAGNCAGLGTLRKQHGLGFYPCTACSSVESRCQSIKPTTGIRVTAWISGGKKRWLCANTQISDLTSMGKLEALSKEWMHEMKPEGMGEQTSRGDGIFTGAEAERSICKMLGRDEAGGREQGTSKERVEQKLAGQALLQQVEYLV